MIKNKSVENIRLPKQSGIALSGSESLNEAFVYVLGKFPELCGERLVLPQYEDKRFKTYLYGTGNPYVVSRDCKIIRPLEDMTVDLFYGVTDTVTGEKLESDSATVIKVFSDRALGVNKKPEVLPGIREWCGLDGELEISQRLICTNSRLYKAAEQATFYIGEMTENKAVLFKNAVPDNGDIIVICDNNLGLGEEGYIIEISEVVKIFAEASSAVIYAGATLAQILMQSCDGKHIPKGILRDYPQYQFRSCMIDVARYYMDIGFLEEVTKYAGFFKLNHIHLHLNDGAGESETTFRIESDKYPELNREVIEKCINGKNKLYTKKDFVKYQESVSEYGIEVIPEIDTPSHCGSVCFASRSPQAAENGFTDVSFNSWQMDLSDGKFENSARFVQSIFDEYTESENAVFRGKHIHIGTDEWIRDGDLEKANMTAAERNECMRKYMDVMIKYINSKGYTPIIWSGLNSGDGKYAGKTPISHDAIFQSWALSYADVELELREKYSIINSNDRDLYIVPGGSYYKTDLDIKQMYDSWYVGDFSGEVFVDEGHPLLLGAETAFWLDVSCASSNIDVFKLLKNQIVLICEKCWYGQKTEGQTAEEYMSRVKRLADYVPGANPGRYYPTDESGTVFAWSFESDSNPVGVDIVGFSRDEGLVLDGNGYITTPVKTAVNPFKLKMEICFAENNGRNSVIFEGTDGKVYFNYESTRKIAFERKGYTYIFNKTIPVGKTVELEIFCDKTTSYLRLDGDSPCKAELIKCEYEYGPYDCRVLNTLQLPLERLFAGIKGKLYSLRLERDNK